MKYREMTIDGIPMKVSEEFFRFVTEEKEPVAANFRMVSMDISPEVKAVANELAKPNPLREDFMLRLTEKFYQPEKLLTMSDFKQYNRKQIAELRPVGIADTAENLKWNGISVSEVDLKNGSPKTGDMIARNPKDHEDQWLVAAEYFKENFEEIKPAGDFKSRLMDEKSELSERIVKLKLFIVSKNFATIDVRQQELLKLQSNIMEAYKWVLQQRINLL